MMKNLLQICLYIFKIYIYNNGKLKEEFFFPSLFLFDLILIEKMMKSRDREIKVKKRRREDNKCIPSSYSSK